MTNKLLSSIIFITFLSITLISNLNAEDKIYKLAVTDIAGLEDLQKEFKAFQNKLSELSGIKVKLYPVSSRTAVVEALKFKKVDFVLSGPAEYLIIAKRAKAKPLVALKRPNYYSVLVTKKDSNIEKISELKSQAVAFGPIGSTSYYLAPLQLLADSGISLKDIKAKHVSKQIAFTALKRGDVKAMGFSHERFKQYVTSDKSVTMDDFRILAKSQHLPNDLIVSGKHVSKEINEKLKNTFVNHSDELITEILKGKKNNKYKNMKFISEIKDSDYDYTKKMYATAGFKEYS